MKQFLIYRLGFIDLKKVFANNNYIIHICVVEF